ncbi:sarcocystatin-A-like [Teleopsis dalmanni]|uniref:sarcocystatin-A-like n=1 Tax=Teleopsis dalmanni TaxID=139649 RepID=UPI0018CD2FB9|nr:sarcocystatin-A-like [Teleopsis dalmanni]
MKLLFLLCLTIVLVVAEDEPAADEIETLTGDQLTSAQEYLEKSLAKIAAGDGPKYKLSKVISATQQVVSGILYKFKTELIDDKKTTKTCDVSISGQPWLENGIEVTFECEGEEKLLKKYSA